MRLSLEEAIAAHNAAPNAEKTLLVKYDYFNNYLENWHKACARKTQGGFFSSLFAKPKEVTFADWTLTHHLDAILAEVSLALLATLEEQWDVVRKWDKQTKYDALFLVATYLPKESSEYRMQLKAVNQKFFTAGQRFKSAFGNTLLGILSLGIAPLAAYASKRRAATIISEKTEVLGRNTADLAWALRKIPRKYIATQPLAKLDAESTDENQRHEHVGKLLRLLKKLHYCRVTVVMDKIDEPSAISGDAEKMIDFAKPLLNNKILQTSGINFKLLFPEQLIDPIRRADSAFHNQARLDKANMLHPFSWSGEHLYEILDERGQACRNPQADETNATPFRLQQLFDDDVTRDMVIAELGKLGIPRFATKFLFRCIGAASESIFEESLTEGQLPKVTAKVFYWTSSQFENEKRTYASDFKE